MTGYLLIRELVMLAVVLAFGAGFCALIQPQDRFGQRLALAPSAGVGLASGILLTLNLVVPLRHAFWWAVVPMALVSVVLIRRSGLRIPPLRELVAVGAVLAVGLGAGSYALVERDSSGPVGYGIFDGPGYITYAEGYETHTNAHPLFDTLWDGHAEASQSKYDNIAWDAPWNISQRYGFSLRWQHTASNTINAVASGAGGWAPWTLATPLIALLLAIGALGTYALAGFFGAGLVARTLAGFVYAGPLVFTIGMDGSEGLVAGLATAPAVLILTVIAFQRPTARTAAMAGAAVGGLQAVYPEISPAVVGGLVLAGVLRFGVPIVRRRAPLSSLLPVVKVLPFAAVALVLVELRALPWTWHYLIAGDATKVAHNGLVPYNMALEYLPGWLYQTREFYSFAFASPSGKEQLLVGVLLPIVMILVSCAALIYSRRARWMSGIVVAVLLQAWWANRSLDCSYCVQRSLLILGPLLPALMLAGASLLMARGGRGRDAVLVLGGLAAVAVVSTTLSTQTRMREGLVVAPRGLEAASKTAGKLKQTTLLEGHDTTPFAAWLYGPTAYAALAENVPRVSVVNEYNEWGGLSYIDPRPRTHPSWTPDYETVVTRFGAVDFPGRKKLEIDRPYTVMERAHPFDIIPATGVATDLAEHDPIGFAWVQPPGAQMGFEQSPLQFWIAADDDRPAYVRFRVDSQTIPNLNVADWTGLKGVRLSRPYAAGIDVCGQAVETGPTRTVRIHVVPPTGPVTPALRRYEQAPQPNHDIRLVSVSATTKPCGR